MDCSNEVTSVESSDDTLLEILFHLPPKSLFKFSCVCKRWKNLIRDPHFFKEYDERSPSRKLLGFVKCNVKRNSFIHPKDWKHGCVSVRSEEFGVDGFFPPERSCFLASSNNGLVLCGCVPSKHSRSKYYVGNPITKTWATLPPPPPPLFPERSLSLGLTSKSKYVKGTGGKVSFRVIVATGDICNKRFGVMTMPIETYSSQKGQWRRSELVSPKPITIRHYWAPTVCGGIFYWMAYQGYVVAFDSSSLDEEDNDDTPVKKDHLLQLIETPNDIGPKAIWASDNGKTLWWAVSSFNLGTVEIYRKNGNEDGWRLVSNVNINTVRQNILKNITSEDLEVELKARLEARRGRESLLLSTIRNTVSILAFIPWDPTLVIARMWERVFVYDWVNQTTDEVLLHNHGDDYFTDRGATWYPYFHPFSLSSSTFK